jgi:hypothetical protein
VTGLVVASAPEVAARREQEVAARPGRPPHTLHGGRHARPDDAERADVDWSRILPAVTVHVHTYAGAEPTDVAGTRRVPTRTQPSPAEVGFSRAIFELVA